jgi:hypothetical protein
MWMSNFFWLRGDASAGGILRQIAFPARAGLDFPQARGRRSRARCGQNPHVALRERDLDPALPEGGKQPQCDV